VKIARRKKKTETDEAIKKEKACGALIRIFSGQVKRKDSRCGENGKKREKVSLVPVLRTKAVARREAKGSRPADVL